MNALILVCLGGMIGAALRYIVGGWVQPRFPGFPYSTLLINVAGTLILSTTMYLTEYGLGFAPEARTFLTIGVLGAFTTMSTFGYETFRLLEQGEAAGFAANLLATNSLVLLAVYAGRFVAQRLAGVPA